MLVDSESHANQILCALVTEYGWALTREECTAEFLGMSMTTIRRRIEQRLGRTLPADFEHRYHAKLFDTFRTSLMPMSGVVEALDLIVMPTCVASSGTRARIRLALTTTGLFDRFAGRIFSAEDVQRGKPAPDLFLHAAQTLGMHPSRCAVIEDSPPGIEAANAAGMTAFGFAGITPPERLRHATGGVFRTMAELPALLASHGTTR